MAIHEIVEARLDGDLQRLSAASLRHVYNIHVRWNGRPFALMSAWQEGEGQEANLRNSERLRHQLSSARLGFCPLMLYCKLADGAWSPEPWLFAFNIALDWAVRLAAEYHQQFLGFSGPGIDAEFKVLWFLKARGTVGYVESFLAFDPWAIAAYFYRRGLIFEYLHPEDFSKRS